jgi:HTH-type transcriptional regulator/antitoxin HigA
MMAPHAPAEAFPPGDFIREEMEALGWSETGLADILGRPVSAVNLLLSGKRAVTPETARALEQAFGIDAQTWLNLEAIYRRRTRPPQE